MGDLTTGPHLLPLILKRGNLSRSSGQWSDDDYDVLEDGLIASSSPQPLNGASYGERG